MPVDYSKVGQSRVVQDPQDALKSSEGTYMDAVTGLPVERKYPLRQMPQAPDPSPFALGSVAKGQR